MDLQAEIDRRAQEIHTDAYSMSINEAVSMYESGDLEIHPEFQRIFRWTIDQQSRLIESIFLGIPIPPIFVAQRQDGVWDVVDGVQRLSTIIRFIGLLKDEEGADERPEALVSGEYVEALRGLFYEPELIPDDKVSDPLLHVLDDAQRRVFKRARLDFQIVQKESDDQAKYDLFQRLNSGTRLSEQEARNCLAVMIDPTFARWIDSLSDFSAFENVLSISDRQDSEGYSNECVLRFLATTHDDIPSLRRMGDVGEYLTNRMRNFASDSQFDRSNQQARFEGVFSLLDEALGSDAFRRYSTQKGFSGRFSVSAFEAVGSGIARNWDFWRERDRADAISDLRVRVPLLWQDSTFDARSGGGKAAERRIPWMVEVGERIFSESFNADA